MPAFRASADEESMQFFNKGNLLIKEEKYDEALGIFEEFLEKYPEIYQAHLNIGTCYLKKGELDKAEAEFKMVLDKILETYDDYKKDMATSLRAFTGLGEVYIQKGDFETWARNSLRDTTLSKRFKKVRLSKISGKDLSDKISQVTQERFKEVHKAIKTSTQWF